MTFEQHALVHRQLALRGLVGAETGEAGGPRRLDLVAGHSRKREFHRGSVAHRAHLELAQGAVVVDHEVGVQPGHQRLGDGVGNWRDEVDEPAAPLGVGHGKDEDHAVQAAYAGVPEHHLAVGQHVRAGNLVDALGVRVAEGLDEVLEDVADTDRLAARLHPPWRDHDRQPLGQAPDQFETHRPGTDDDRGTELDHRHATGGQDTAHLVARVQVIAQGLGRVAQPPQVDDPADARPSGRRGEDLRNLAVALGEGLAARHRMHQVVRDVNAIQRSTRCVLVGEVALDQLHAGPPTTVEPAGVAGYATNARTLVAHPLHQPATDVPGRAGDQDPRPRGPPVGVAHSRRLQDPS